MKIWNNVLKWIIYISLAIVPFLAWYVSGFGIQTEWNSMLFPYISGKNFAFRIVIEIALFSWFILMLINKNYRPKKNILLWGYGIFMFILLIADIFSVNSTKSFFSNFERMEGFITHIHLFAYFLIMISMFKNHFAWAKYRRIFFWSNIPVLAVAFLQLFGLKDFWFSKLFPALSNWISTKLIGGFAPTQGGLQLDSTLGNSTYLAIYVVFFMYLFLNSFISSKIEKGYYKWKYLVMFILNLIILYYTQTRGAQVGLIAGVIVTSLILLIGGRKLKDFKIAKRISISIIIVMVVGYIGLLSLNGKVKSGSIAKLTKIADFANPITLPSKIGAIKKELYNPTSTYQSLLTISKDGTFTSRILNIKIALAGWKERPLFGWGQDNYFYVFAKYNDARMYAQEPWFDRTHNVFMDWLISAGIIGLISYLSLYVLAFILLWNKNSQKLHSTKKDFIEKALLSGLLVSYFIHNIFVFDHLVSYILFVFILAYIAIRFGKEEKENHIVLDTKKNTFIIFAPVIIILFIVSLYFFNIRYISANRDIINGLSPRPKAGESGLDTFKRSLNSFKSSCSVGGVAHFECREQLAQTTLSLISQVRQSKIPPTAEYEPVYKLVSDFIDTTKQEYKKIVDIKNSDPRSLSIYSSFLRAINDNTEALKYGKLAYQYATEKQTIATLYVQELLTAKNFEEANKVAKHIYESDTSYPDGKALYESTRLFLGKFDEVENELKDEKGFINLSNDSYNAYISLNQKSRLYNILANNVRVNPKDLQSNVSLAQLYLEDKNKFTAINILENFAKLSPEYKEKVDAYIKEINK